MNEQNIKEKSRRKAAPALVSCFPLTIPVMAGYIFLGVTYGLLMRTAGFPFWLPTLTAAVIYTGSMEFLMVEILASSFHPLSAMATAFMVGARHLFYGLAMLQKYGNTGWKKFYLIYTTSDETFAVNYGADVPEGVDRGWFYFWVSLLDQMYWVGGATLGAFFGRFLTFDTEGLDFVMTAMFIVILLAQWEKDGTRLEGCLRDHAPEITGLGASFLCLLLFGPDDFLIPSMILILALLLIFRKPIAMRRGEVQR